MTVLKEVSFSWFALTLIPSFLVARTKGEIEITMHLFPNKRKYISSWERDTFSNY